MVANAIVIGAAGAEGKTSAGAASLGGSFAVNVLNRSVRASVSDSTVTAASAVQLDAIAKGTIWAMTIGAVGAGGRGEQNFGGALTVAGAGSVNQVGGDIDAIIERSTVTTTGTGADVSLNAQDQTNIMANAGLLGVAVGLGNKAIAASLGGSVAINSVSGAIRAKIVDSSVTSSGGLALSAISNTNIWAMTLAGVGAGGKGTGSYGLAFSGAGAGSVEHHHPPG